MNDLIDEFAMFDETPLTLEDYAAQAMDKAIYPDALIYPMLGLSGEVGELAEKLKKFFRDNDYEVSMEDPVVEMPASLRLDMARELGDVLWYLTAIASDLGYELEEIAGLNLEKLDSRKRRNKIRGNGDYR